MSPTSGRLPLAGRMTSVQAAAEPHVSSFARPGTNTTGLTADPNAPEASSWQVEYALFFVMGMSGWWTVNALTWAQVPLFVQRTQEKEAIGTVLNLACQLGNIAPFAYKAIFSKATQAAILPGSILVSQLIAVAVAVVAAFYWDQESHLIFQGKHSVVLVACTIVAGGVGTLSNVTYWALCVRYKGTHCTKGMSVGMTVGGLLLQLCALAQGVGKPKPRFSAKTFMLGVASVQAFFAVAVMFIIRRPHPQEERTPKSLRNVPRGDLAPRETFTRTASKRTFGGSDVQLNKLHQPLLPSAIDEDAEDSISAAQQNLILVIMFLLYGLTYSLPGFEPFMVKGYNPPSGNGSHTSDISGSSSGAYFDTVGDPSMLLSAGDGAPAPTMSGPHLMMLMNLGVQIGDVSGRASTAVPWIPSTPPLVLMTLVVIVISLLLIGAAVWWRLVPTTFPGDTAYIFPLMFFMYYFTRGYLVTIMYVRVKLLMPRSSAESFSANMGLCGQVGAFVSCLLVFWLVNFLKLFPTRL